MRHGVCKILVRDGVDVSGSTLIQKRRGASVEQDDSAIIDWNNRARAARSAESFVQRIVSSLNAFAGMIPIDAKEV